MERDVESILVPEEELKSIVKRLGEEITKDYQGKDLLVVGVLKGSTLFLADLIREIKCDCLMDFIAVSSYSGTKTTGVVRFKKDLDIDPVGKDILIIEDILDSGITLSYLKGVFEGRNINSIKICTLLDRPINRVAPITADYIGKEIPDGFVIGYGLDYDERYRNLPYVGILKPSVYEQKGE